MKMLKITKVSKLVGKWLNIPSSYKSDQCTTCDVEINQKFESKNILEEHIKEVTFLKCTNCNGSDGPCKDKKEEHIQLVHSFKCDFCGVDDIKTQSDLDEHIKLFHNFKCSLCENNQVFETNDALKKQKHVELEHFEKLYQSQNLTQSRIEILEVALDRSKKLEVENRKFNVRQINFLKAEMERMMSNFEKMNQSDRSAQDRIKILEVENQNLLKSWKSAQGRNLKLKRELQNEKDLRICKICMDEEISHVFLPCGHAICCKNCINNIQKCPNCRTNVCNSMMLYF